MLTIPSHTHTLSFSLWMSFINHYNFSLILICTRIDYDYDVKCCWFQLLGCPFHSRRVVHACMLTRNCIETMYLATDYGVRDRFIFRPIFQNAISFGFFFFFFISFLSFIFFFFFSFSHVWHEKTAKFKRNSTAMCHFHLVQERTNPKSREKK